MSNRNEKKQKTVQKVGVECIFRVSGGSREFITPGGTKWGDFEAFNMLMNKLDKKGIKNKKGKLVFEFEV